MKKFLIAAAFAAGLATTGSASAAVNLVTNGDFESAIGDPNTSAGRGFDTDYAYRTGLSNAGPDDGVNNMWGEGTWTIGTNPHDSHALWIDQELNGTKLLILNGKTSGLPSVAWSQEFAVAGGLYAYAFDIYNIYAGGEPSHLDFEVSTDGGSTYTLLDSVQTTPPGDAGLLWHQAGTFTVGAGNMRVSLRNTLGGAGGNDFAIDNISVSAVVPEPATWGMMILGFAGVGAALRSSRRRSLVAA